jgi:hypothetical protein
MEFYLHFPDFEAPTVVMRMPDGKLYEFFKLAHLEWRFFTIIMEGPFDEV